VEIDLQARGLVGAPPKPFGRARLEAERGP
jgi:hypothetical protein